MGIKFESAAPMPKAWSKASIAQSEEKRFALPAPGLRWPGWFPVQTEAEGVILVNPAQVAYVRDVPDQEPVLDQAL